MRHRDLAMKALGLLVIALPAVAEPRMVFIPEGGADSILMVGAETGETVRRIEGIEAVHGLSGAPGVPFLVAGSYAETLREDIAAMAQPEGVSADDHAAHHKSAAQPLGPKDAGLSIVTILDASNGDILRRIEVPGAVHHTAVSHDGRFAVATHPAGEGISVIDLSGFSVTGHVATGAMPNYATFGTDPALVYVSNTGTGTLFVSSRAEAKVWMIDAATLEERGVIPVEGEGHQMVALP